MDSSRQRQRLLQQAREDPDVLAVVLFGSAARGEASSESDVDICLILTPDKRDSLQLSRKRLAYLTEVDLDVQIFQELPLYVRHRVLKEGTVLFTRDEDALYEQACRTAREYEDYRPVYKTYLAEVARGGS
jgi:predicted nucleotidyltransferase